MKRLTVWFLSALLVGFFSASSVEAKSAKHQNQNRSARSEEGSRIKHRGMDKDHDGVITRDEWRGNDRSFENHDEDNDGKLSGEELRPGAHHADQGISDDDKTGQDVKKERKERKAKNEKDRDEKEENPGETEDVVDEA